MRLISDNGRYRVPFEFEVKPVTVKVTRYTTFNDVVHMLIYKAVIPKTSATFYAVYECTGDLERKIGGAVRVLSIWKSWGCESSHFRFVVKHTDNNISFKHLDRSPKAEGGIDQKLSQSYKKANTQKLMVATRDSTVTNGSSLKGSEMEQFSWVTLVNHNCASLANIAFHLDQTVSKNTSRKTSSRTEQRNNESGGKKALLAKYLNDLKFFNKRKSKKTPGKLGEREQADGAEVPEVCIGRHVEGMEDPSAPLRSSFLNSSTVSMAKCRYHWERHCDSDTDTDSDISEKFLDSEPESDEESDVSNTSSLACDIRALDTAFIKSSRCSESDEGIDVTSMTSSDLNTAFVVDFDRKCSTDEEYSALAYSVCDLENNFSTSDYVRKVFGADDTQSFSSQDDEVDSFMRSSLGSF